MMNDIRLVAGCLLFFAAITGCNDSKPPSGDAANQQRSPSYLHDSADTEYFAPGPEFKLSREAAAQKAWETPVAEVASPEAENGAEEPRRKTVLESLFQAVRHGAAEALDESAAGK